MSETRSRQQVFRDMMQELDAFREEYVNRHQIQGLEREDPDVKRLTEAMGFFAARIQHAGQSYLEGMRRSLLKEFFPYLLSPVPSMVMLQAVPTAKLSEVTVLPPGTVLTGHVLEHDKQAVVRTLDELTVLPLEISRIIQSTDKGSRATLEIKFRGSYRRNDELKSLRLFVNQVDDYVASVRIHELLRNHVERAYVTFTEADGLASSSHEALPVELSFPGSKMMGQKISWHPLERERWFFQLPERDLFINLEMPRAPRNWQTFSVFLELKDWPRTVRLANDALRLFVVPVANLVRDFADPIRYAG